MKKAYVIMTNDYPTCVMLKAPSLDAVKRFEEYLNKKSGEGSRFMHVGSYEVPLVEEVPVE